MAIEHYVRRPCSGNAGPRYNRSLPPRVMPRSLAAAVRRFVSATSRARGESYLTERPRLRTRANLEHLRGRRAGDTHLRRLADARRASPRRRLLLPVLRGLHQRVQAHLGRDSRRRSGARVSRCRPSSSSMSTTSGSMRLSPSPAHSSPFTRRQTTRLADLPVARHAAQARRLARAAASCQESWSTLLDLARSTTAGGLVIELLTRERKKSGEWGRPKAVTINRHDIATLPRRARSAAFSMRSAAPHTHMAISARPGADTAWACPCRPRSC